MVKIVGLLDIITPTNMEVFKLTVLMFLMIGTVKPMRIKIHHMVFLLSEMKITSVLVFQLKEIPTLNTMKIFYSHKIQLVRMEPSAILPLTLVSMILVLL